jgi:Ca2+/Na+ antiporter
MAEVTILPLIHGISPLLVRLQGATHNLDFSFNLGGSLGAIFNILAFGVGICAAVLGYSSKVYTGKLIVHIAFMFLAVGLYFMVTLTKEAGVVEAGLFIFLYLVYLFVRWMMSKTAKGKFSIFRYVLTFCSQR